MKKFLALITLLLLVASVDYAYAGKPKQLTNSITWELKDDGTLVIEGYGNMPDFKREKGAPWSKKAERITSVEIGEGITSIGANNFRYDRKFHYNIQSVTLPSTLKTIGYYAFCSNNITSLTIPESVTTIGDGAFHSNNITSLTIPNGVTTIGDHAFCSNDITSLTIPKSVRSIGYCAFSSNDITSLTIPNGVTSIGEWAFHGNNITSLTIPNSVTYIGGEAFQNNNITSLTIPESVTTIGDYAFRGNNISVITHLPSWITEYNCTRIGISKDAYFAYLEYRPTVSYIVRRVQECKNGGKYKEALEYALRGIDLDVAFSEKKRFYNSAIECYERLGDYNNALDIYIEIYNNEKNGLNACNVADYYINKFNNKAEALKWYNTSASYDYEGGKVGVTKYTKTTASVDKIWAAHSNNESVFHIHNLKINYAYKQNLTLKLYIYDEKKNRLTDTNNRYYSPDGYIEFVSQATSSYLHSRWDDYKITVPTSEIHVDCSQRTRKLYCKLVVIDTDGTVVYTSDYFPFELSKISQQNKTHTTNNTTQNKNNEGTNVTKKNEADPVYGYRDVWVSCNVCWGSGRCPTCGGKGYREMVSYSGTTYYDCGCGGLGTCYMCRGTGGHYEKQKYQIR